MSEEEWEPPPAIPAPGENVVMTGAGTNPNVVTPFGDLNKISIERNTDGTWRIVREREETGESARCGTLEECFDFVRIYFGY